MRTLSSWTTTNATKFCLFFACDDHIELGMGWSRVGIIPNVPPTTLHDLHLHLMLHDLHLYLMLRYMIFTCIFTYEDGDGAGWGGGNTKRVSCYATWSPLALDVKKDRVPKWNDGQNAFFALGKQTLSCRCNEMSFLTGDIVIKCHGVLQAAHQVVQRDPWFFPSGKSYHLQSPNQELELFISRLVKHEATGNRIPRQ